MLGKTLDTQLFEMISEIHNSDWFGVLEEAGTGSWCQTLLQSVSGSSRTLQAAHAHYSQASQLDYYGDQGRSVSQKSVKHWAKFHLNSASSFFSLAVSGVVSSERRQSGDCHAWVALALSDGRGWSIHVRLLDSKRILQQQAIGLFNLYLLWQLARFNHLEIEHLPESLKNRLEIDFWLDWHASSPAHYVDALALVCNGWTSLVLLTPKNGHLQPVRYLDYLRGSTSLVHKGSFNPPTKAHLAMVQAVLSQEDSLPYQPVLEIALNNADKGLAQQENLLHRLAMLAHQPWLVALTNTTTLYQTRELFAQQGQCQKLDFVCGEDLYRRLFMKKYYLDLPGGIQMGLARLFQMHTLIWCCGRKTNLEHSVEAREWAKIYQDQVNKIELSLPIASSDIRCAIAEGRLSWKEMVETGVCEYIEKYKPYSNNS